VKEIFYNVWWKLGEHWTINMIDHIDSRDRQYQQDINNPVPLTKDQAVVLMRQLLDYCRWSVGDYEVRPIIKKIIKIIPGFELDPSLSVLHAGYLQDRQRKQFK
jgi:hypothetical protein